MIKPLSNLYNTGGFFQEAPQISTESPTGVAAESSEGPLVPLSSPTATT